MLTTIVMANLAGVALGIALALLGGRLAARYRYREERAIVRRATDAWLNGEERKVA